MIKDIGRYEAAIPRLREAVEWIEKLDTPTDYVKALVKLEL